MKIKKIIDGKEVEIELTDDELRAAGLYSQTTLLEDESLFNEAMEMRGVKVNSKSKALENVQITQLTNTIKELQTIIADEKKARIEAFKSLEEKSKKDLQIKIESDLDNAVKSGQITPEQKTLWSDRLNKDYDSFSVVLNELPKTTKTEPGKTQAVKTETTGVELKADKPITNKILERNQIIN